MDFLFFTFAQKYILFKFLFYFFDWRGGEKLYFLKLREGGIDVYFLFIYFFLVAGGDYAEFSIFHFLLKRLRMG